MNQKDKQEQGRNLEKRLAKKLDLNLVKGSGNQKFYKLDLEGRNLLISAKWTAEKSYRLSNYDIDEVYNAAKGMGSKGEITPIVVAEIEGKDIACLPLDELIGLLKEEAKIFSSTSTDDKIATSNIPEALRD